MKRSLDLVVGESKSLAWLRGKTYVLQDHGGASIHAEGCTTSSKEVSNFCFMILLSSLPLLPSFPTIRLQQCLMLALRRAPQDREKDKLSTICAMPRSTLSFQMIHCTFRDPGDRRNCNVDRKATVVRLLVWHDDLLTAASFVAIELA